MTRDKSICKDKHTCQDINGLLLRYMKNLDEVYEDSCQDINEDSCRNINGLLSRYMKTPAEVYEDSHRDINEDSCQGMLAETILLGSSVRSKTGAALVQSWDTTSISLSAGCDLFMRYVTRTSALEYEDFYAAKLRLIERGEKFGEISMKARRTIAMLAQEFVFDGCTILVHGFSRVVLEVLKLAASNKKLFKVFCTEGRPDRTGLRLSKELAALDIPVKLLLDSAVAYTMDEVDMVFVGADGVVESGGIINMMGTYQTALVAHCMNKPVYVAAESYKFARLYPLDQKDLEPALRPIDFGVPVPPDVKVETSARDYTPPQFLTLLFTDLGVLTPSVVSDELIQLYL